MNIKNNWRDTIGISFSGWRFVLNLAISWIFLQIIKSILLNNGIILGGFLATILLFVGVWLVGLPYALSHPTVKNVHNSNVQQETVTLAEVFKKNKGLRYFAIVTAVLFLTMVTLVSFFSK
jgi:hypothetical protein